MNSSKFFPVLLLFFLTYPHFAQGSGQDFYPWSVSAVDPAIYEEKTKKPDKGDINTNPAISIVWMINLYGKTSSSEQACTFEPTCSNYTKQAIVKYGILLGLVMGSERLIRYHHDHGSYELYPTKAGYRLYDPLDYNDFWF